MRARLIGVGVDARGVARPGPIPGPPSPRQARARLHVSPPV